MITRPGAFRIVLGPDGNDPATKVVVDGRDIGHTLTSLSLSAGAGEVTAVTLEYACTEGAVVHGRGRIHHVCPAALPGRPVICGHRYLDGGICGSAERESHGQTGGDHAFLPAVAIPWETHG